MYQGSRNGEAIDIIKCAIDMPLLRYFELSERAAIIGEFLKKNCFFVCENRQNTLRYKCYVHVSLFPYKSARHLFAIIIVTSLVAAPLSQVVA